jgi:site-specific DNA-methyltransferase (adenine-specific)
MKPTLIIGNAVIYAGNNLNILPELQSNSVDSIVCDPPYELGFMGKSWDSSGIAYSVELWQHCLRVLKPGGHLLAFGGTRTWHRLAVAIEDAGFEIRDNIAWLYGSGFPKSHNISKAIDKAAGAEREVTGKSNRHGGGTMQGHSFQVSPVIPDITASATDDAKAWDGWGTALKPAHEPIVVARKPVIGTVADNVLKYGTGAINIDATRIQGQMQSVPQPILGVKECIVYGFGTGNGRNGEMSDNTQGRWPANIILDEHTAQLLDEQSGINKPKAERTGKVGGQQGLYENGHKADYVSTWVEDAGGGASRFFYVAKASKRDRNEGLDELPKETAGKFAQDKWTEENMNFNTEPKQNFHPTVKPTTLMQYLIRLVTPDNGVVLDPFAGSGSTGKAAILENKRFIGIELTAEYLPIIEGRLRHAYLTLDDKEDDLFE